MTYQETPVTLKSVHKKTEEAVDHAQDIGTPDSLVQRIIEIRGNLETLLKWQPGS